MPITKQDFHWLEKKAKASIDLRKKGYNLEIINMSVTLFCHERAEWTYGSGAKGMIYTGVISKSVQ